MSFVPTPSAALTDWHKCHLVEHPAQHLQTVTNVICFNTQRNTYRLSMSKVVTSSIHHHTATSLEGVHDLSTLTPETKPEPGSLHHTQLQLPDVRLSHSKGLRRDAAAPIW